MSHSTCTQRNWTLDQSTLPNFAHFLFTQFLAHYPCQREKEPKMLDCVFFFYSFTFSSHLTLSSSFCPLSTLACSKSCNTQSEQCDLLSSYRFLSTGSPPVLQSKKKKRHFLLLAINGENGPGCLVVLVVSSWQDWKHFGVSCGVHFIFPFSHLFHKRRNEKWRHHTVIKGSGGFFLAEFQCF